jgi:hypothetical protein
MSVVVVMTAAATLVGCNSSTPNSTTPNSSTPTGGAGVDVTSTAAAKPTTAALPKNGKCVLLTTEKAATLLGATPKSSSTDHSGDSAIIHIDGCTHIAATGNLGYDINEYAGADSTTVIIQQATAAAGRAPGAKKFAVPGGDASIGFTTAVGSKTMARIAIAKGAYTVSVNATNADATKARQIALDAAAILVSAIP